MTMALIAQGVIHQLRQRLGAPFDQWDSAHLAQDLFSGLEGDVRVHGDTVRVTYYNAPQASQWKEHWLILSGSNHPVPFFRDAAGRGALSSAPT
jgi:hypothetical protein